MQAWRYAYVHDYLTYCRAVLRATEDGKRVVRKYGDEPISREQWRAEFLRALDHRINLKAGPYPRWRKLDDIYQTELQRDARRIRDCVTRRYALHQIMTPELRARFGHLISTVDD